MKLTSIPYRTTGIFFLIVAASLAVPLDTRAQQDYYFSEDASFDENIPTPQEFLGYEIGSQYTRHDRIVAYFKKLAEVSEKASFQRIGETYEQRPQIVLTVTAPSNHGSLEQIRKTHRTVLDPSAPPLEPQSDPVVVALDYSVHGDETSSGEAALLTAYYLVAEQSAQTQKYLEESVVLIDPAQNPDGRDRAAQFHNMYESFPPVADPADRVHNQPWPGGRTNHFWHDLNRDWFPVTQKETENRLDFYHRWYPNVQIDFHEMGTNSTYYLEPSKPVRTWNPIVPDYHYKVLNPLLAQYQTKALDEIGSLYWTKEIFDNISPIYGSTYPDTLARSVRYDYETRSDRYLANTIPGIIVEADIDPSHPVAFGVPDRTQLFMQDNDTFLKPSKNPYATVAEYKKNPLVGGYAKEENLEKISGTSALVTGSKGKGNVVLFADNPNFRSYWHTTSRLFLNALLFGRNL